MHVESGAGTDLNRLAPDSPPDLIRLSWRCTHHGHPDALGASRDNLAAERLLPNGKQGCRPRGRLKSCGPAIHRPNGQLPPCKHRLRGQTSALHGADRNFAEARTSFALCVAPCSLLRAQWGGPKPS